MNKPTLTIDGKKIEMPKPTVGTWRKIMEFNSMRQNVKWADVVDAYVSIIALAFGITVDELIDKDEKLVLEYEDILPIYDSVVVYLANLFVSKVGDNKKNAELTTAQN